MRRMVCVLVLLAAGAATAAPPNGLVILLTDYGADSIYVGILKGAMYRKDTRIQVDSITNSVPAYDIAAGAYLLAEACPMYPPGTVFCAIVDPGVGTARKPVAIETANGYFFVGPDNGLFTLVAEAFGVKEIRELANTAYWRDGAQTSTTFHGRDIFGPVSAALAAGAPMQDLGPLLSSLVMLELPRGTVANGAAQGTVIRLDVYGNVVTSLRGADLDAIGVAPGMRARVRVGESEFTAVRAGTYADVPVGAEAVLVQSMGLVELAVNQGSMAERWRVPLHAGVTLTRVEEIGAP